MGDCNEENQEQDDLAQILVGAALIINADDTVVAMQKTNNRIYAAFQAHDTYLSQHAGLPQARFGWAAKYKTYMDNYVNYRNGASASLLQPLLTTVGNDLKVANNNVANKVSTEIDPYINLHQMMTNYYTGSGAGASELNWAINREWNTANVKREEFENAIFKRQACSRPIGTQQSTRSATGSASGTGASDITTNEPDATSTGSPTNTQQSTGNVNESMTGTGGSDVTTHKPDASITQPNASTTKPDATTTKPNASTTISPSIAVYTGGAEEPVNDITFCQTWKDCPDCSPGVDDGKICAATWEITTQSPGHCGCTTPG